MGMSYFSNSKNIKQAKEAAGQMQAGAIFGLEATKANEARNVAGEEAASNVFAMLGQPGTYGAGAPGPSNKSIFDTSGTGLSAPDKSLAGFGSYGGTGQLEGARKGIIDPKAYAEVIGGTIPFQIQSQQVAESNQLLNKEGPAWDMLENSTLGQIHQGAALQLRDTIRGLKNQYAKGGSARRTALNEANTLKAQADAMNMQTEQTWRANLELHSYVRANADRVAAGTQRFMDGLPGINMAYRQSMAETAKLMVFAGESAASIAKEAYEVRASQQAKNVGGKLLEGLTMAAASSLLGGASSAIQQGMGGGFDSIDWKGTGAGMLGDFTGGFNTAMGNDLASPQSPYPTYGDAHAKQQAAIDAKKGIDTRTENWLSPSKDLTGTSSIYGMGGKSNIA